MNLNLKYRPQTWNEVVGQDSTIKILKKQTEEDKPANVIILKGATGGGKTTTARIYAREINKDPNYIAIEIDAASNSGVDNIRNVIEDSQTRSLNSKYKIYIIDEAHMLTTAAWNALLKTFEEPNPYTIFILCTTDPQKIPATIMNRAQTFNINKIPNSLIKNRLEYICQNENINNYEESIDYVSKVSNGCMREAITLLDKIIVESKTLDINKTLEILGNYNYDIFFDLTNSLIDDRKDEILNIINYLYNQGNDLKLFVDQYLKFIIDVSKYIIFNNCSLTNIPLVLENEVKNLINLDNPSNYYNYLMDKTLELKNMLKNDVDIKSTVEVVCLQMSRMV